MINKQRPCQQACEAMCPTHAQRNAACNTNACTGAAMPSTGASRRSSSDKPGGGTKGSAVQASLQAIKALLGTAEKKQPRSGNNKDPEQQAQAAGLVGGISSQWTHQAQGHAALHAVAQVSFCFGLKRDRSTKWPPLQKQRRKALSKTRNSERRLTSRSTTSWSHAEAPRLRPPEKEAAAATLLRPGSPCDKLQHPAGQAS